VTHQAREEPGLEARDERTLRGLVAEEGEVAMVGAIVVVDAPAVA